MSNMETVKYVNGRLIDAKCDYTGVLYTEGSNIRYAGQTDPGLPFDRIVDLAGLSVFPGFIDLHCHLRDPGYPQKETMETGMRAALSGGYVTLCAMANTSPVMETVALVQANQNKAMKLGICHLIQAAAAGKNLDDLEPTDWTKLSRVTPMITNDGKTITSQSFMEQLLIASSENGFIISTHCQPERSIVARDLALVKNVGGNLHVGHISHRETVEMIRKAKAAGTRVTCEITPHHLIGYDSAYPVNPPLRTRFDVDALIAAIHDGTADCLATDHAPHTPKDKAAGMAGISNIEYAMGAYLWVFREYGIPMTRFAQMTSLNPAKLLGLHAGRLKEGYPADLAMIDLAREWSVDPDAMVSRSHNTPFAGHPLLGKVMTTIVGGEMRYDHGSFIR